MRHRTRLQTMIAMIVAAAFLLGACGDDDSTADTTATGPVGDDTVEETTGSDEGEGGTPSGAIDAMDISSLSDSECLAVGNALTGIQGRGIIGDFESDLTTFGSFAAGNPDEVRAEIEVMLDAYQSSYRMLEDADVSLRDPDSVQANQDTVNAATELIETPEVESAFDTTEEAFFDACPMMR